MSSTNRSSLVTNPSEFYETPAWATRAILPHLTLGYGPILDAGAGTGAIAKVVAEKYDLVAGRLADERLTGIELDPERARQCRANGIDCVDGDFLKADYPKHFKLVISNPPFSLALEFIKKALEAVSHQGIRMGSVAMLLRLNFLGGQKRASWHRVHPASVYVLPRRPSFTGQGTDSCEYAWFVWTPDWSNRIEVLNVGAKEAANG